MILTSCQTSAKIQRQGNNSMKLKIERIHPTFGAELTNINSKDINSDQVFSKIRRAFTDFGMIFVRSLYLSLSEQVELGRRFGEVQVHVMNQYHVEKFPEIYFLTNLDENGVPSGAHPDMGTLHWHTDASWRRRTGQATIMVAEEVPNEGGETHFCCMEAAYQALDAETKDEISTLKVVHNLDFSRNRRHGHDPLSEKQKAEIPPVAHPMVRRHPETGRKSLLLGDHAEYVEGMDYGQGRALIDALNERAVRSDLIYAHKYQPGDLMVWDNRRMQHKATPYDTLNERRVMRRTTVIGEIPS